MSLGRQNSQHQNRHSRHDSHISSRACRSEVRQDLFNQKANLQVSDGNDLIAEKTETIKVNRKLFLLHSRYFITALPLVVWLAYLVSVANELLLPIAVMAIVYLDYSLFAGIKLVSSPWLAKKILVVYVMVGAALIPAATFVLFYFFAPANYPVLFYYGGNPVGPLVLIFIAYFALDIAFIATPLCPFRNYTVPLKFQKNYGFPPKNVLTHGCTNCSILWTGPAGGFILFLFMFVESLMLSTHLLH